MHPMTNCFQKCYYTVSPYYAINNWTCDCQLTKYFYDCCNQQLNISKKFAVINRTYLWYLQSTIKHICGTAVNNKTHRRSTIKHICGTCRQQLNISVVLAINNPDVLLTIDKYSSTRALWTFRNKNWNRPPTLYILENLFFAKVMQFFIFFLNYISINEEYM